MVGLMTVVLSNGNGSHGQELEEEVRSQTFLTLYAASWLTMKEVLNILMTSAMMQG
jgi:hypothetical protein